MGRMDDTMLDCDGYERWGECGREEDMKRQRGSLPRECGYFSDAVRPKYRAGAAPIRHY